VTNEKGQASVVLQNCYPFPKLESPDKEQLTANHIPNPNKTDEMLNIEIPDFEGGKVKNSITSRDDSTANDGVAVILAWTWGRDQDTTDVKVWNTNLIVFSKSVDMTPKTDDSYGYEGFYANVDKTELDIGESAIITIRLHDIHGNPVAANSTLTASAPRGRFSKTEFISDPDTYGYGKTTFWTQFTNNLIPLIDESTEVIVTIELISPNGSGEIKIPFYLKVS